MRFLLPHAILLWLINTSLALHPDNLYDLDLYDDHHTQDSIPATGYKTDFHKHKAETMIHLLSNIMDHPDLSRRDAMNALGGGAELVHGAANFISVFSNGCPSRTDADFAECDYCRNLKTGKKQKRSPEPRGGGRGGSGGGKGGGGKKGKMNLGASGRGAFDCNGWNF